MNMLVRTLLVVVMVIALVYVVSRHHHHDKVEPDEASEHNSPPNSNAAGPTAKLGPVHEMRTITAEQRAEIAAQIAAARAARAEHEPSAPTEAKPATPPDPNQDFAAYADSFAVGMSDALKPLIGSLADCVKDRASDAGSHRNATVQITLNGDPDVGTLVTTDYISDGTGQRILPEFERCVRGVLDAAELPPIKEGATLKTQFTFDLD